MSDQSQDDPDRFTAPRGSVVLTQCVYCRHLAPSTLGFGCKAYPGGVPDEIVTNSADHRQPFDGDDGVRFQPRPDVPALILRNLYAELDRV